MFTLQIMQQICWQKQLLQKSWSISWTWFMSPSAREEAVPKLGIFFGTSAFSKGSNYSFICKLLLNEYSLRWRLLGLAHIAKKKFLFRGQSHTYKFSYVLLSHFFLLRFSSFILLPYWFIIGVVIYNSWDLA